MDSDIEMLNDVMFMVDSVYKAYLKLQKPKKIPLAKKRKLRSAVNFNKAMSELKRQRQLKSPAPTSRPKSTVDEVGQQTLDTAPKPIVKLECPATGTAPEKTIDPPASSRRQLNNIANDDEEDIGENTPTGEKQSGRKKIWVHEKYLERDKSGFFATSFVKMKTENPAEFRKQTRMSPETFDVLYGLLEDRLVKNSMRAPIPAECRLFLTLIHLAQGLNRQQLSEQFKMSVNAVRRITIDTCEIIWEALKDEYFRTPTTTDWERIAAEYNEALYMPNCIGTIGVKLIDMKCRGKSQTSKKNPCNALLGACDVNHRFTVIDVGLTEAGEISFSEFGKRLRSDACGLHLPADIPLPSSDASFPHYFVGNSSFPLKSFIMTPYPEESDNDEFTEMQEHFNRCLAEAQNISENAFGVLTTRWQVMHGTLNMTTDSLIAIINAVVMLHNFLKTEDVSYCPPEYVDRMDENGLMVEGAWRRELPPLESMAEFSVNDETCSDMKLRDVLQEHLFFQNTYLEEIL